MATPKLDIHDMAGKVIDKVKLPKEVSDYRLNKTLLHQAVRMYLANMRKGTASTKNRDEVSGGGKKPWKQKGTGRARVGSTRNPLWRGGGAAFGPRPKDYSYSIPIKMKKKAFVEALIDKIKTGSMVVVDKLEVEKPKTKAFVKFLSDLKIAGEKSILVLGEGQSEEFEKAGRNLPNVILKRNGDANAYEVLRSSKVLVTRHYLDNFLKKI